MPVSQIDAIAALIVIDLQKGIVRLPTADPAGDIVARAAQLADVFRQRELPVALVNVAGRAPGRTSASAPKFSLPPDWAELVPELNQQSSDHVVTKQRLGAFIGTDLDEFLRGKGVTQVFIIGIATSIGVESTARSAYDLGYNVVLITDAMTDMGTDVHRHSIEKVFPRIGETDLTENVLRLLTQ